MRSVFVPVMAFYPETIDYSLIGTDFTIIQTFKDGETPAPKIILSAAKQMLDSLFGGTATIEESTGKVALTVTGVDRAKVEAYLEALKACIDFMKL